MPRRSILTERQRLALFDLPTGNASMLYHYILEREWRDMRGGKRSVPDNPSGSFVNFVKSYVKQNGAAQLLI